MNRRRFLRLLCASGTGVLFDHSLRHPLPSLAAGAGGLPDPQINPFSSEIVLNSRLSYHSGYNGTLSNQILANVLWAASRAPILGSTRIIYVATPDNVYRYDPSSHDLTFHVSGNQMSESNLAFEVGVAGDLAEDAGAALHYANIAATSFWEDTSYQPSCCPKESGRTNANNRWDPDSNIQMVNCYGLMPTVSGITSECVANSSNGSLPDPVTDGPMLLENALGNLRYGDQFLSTELSINEISQLAWASYGNTPHRPFGGRGGLTVASAVANYYLTGRIYIVHSEGVDRYHIRLPSGDPTTRDHRIEEVTYGDRRPQLRAAAYDIPETAPNYFVYCAEVPDRWQRIEAGFCAASVLLQARSLHRQGYFTANFTVAERSAIIAALGIPLSDLPLVIFSVGRSKQIHERIPYHM